MRLEAGDYFVVTRGFEIIRTSPIGLIGMATIATKTDSSPQYDRSKEGMVFRAIEVCDIAVAAECVFASGYKKDRIGKVESLNLSELEVMTVTRKYVAALGITAEAAKPQREGGAS